MYKKATFCLASVALILTGCGTKEEFAKGENLYQLGDYESLLEAREFFNKYAEKNPSDNDVEEYFTKIDKALVVEAKDLTNEYFEKKEFKKALEYVTIAKQAAPNDKEVQKAYKTIKSAYDNQVIYDNFTDYLEERYIDFKSLVDTWDKGIKLIETGNAPEMYSLTVAKNLYPEVVHLRDVINAQSFSITGPDQVIFQETNSILFGYIVNIESQLSGVIRVTDDDLSVTSIKQSTDAISPEKFNENFLSAAEKINSYVDEKDNDGKEVRSLKNTLNFTEAYQEKIEKDKKAAEEAALKAQPLRQPAIATPPAK